MRAMSERDWESIEREYRAGALSVAEIGRQYGVSPSTIHSRAKSNGWKRDLGRAVRERAESLSLADGTNSAGDTEGIIEGAAERGAAVIQLHRADVRQGRETVEMMLRELREECADPETLAEVVEGHIKREGMPEKAAYAARKAVSLPSRAATARDLAQSMQRLISLERQAHSLDDPRKEPDENPPPLSVSFEVAPAVDEVPVTKGKAKGDQD